MSEAGLGGRVRRRLTDMKQKSQLRRSRSVGASHSSVRSRRLGSLSVRVKLKRCLPGTLTRRKQRQLRSSRLKT